MEGIKYLVNEDGEILNQIMPDEKVVTLKIGDSILRKTSKEYLASRKELKYHFIKVNDIALAKLASYPLSFYLMKYISFPDNVIVYKNGRIIKQKDLHNVIPLSQRTIIKQLKELKEMDVIKFVITPDKQRCIVFNPFIATKAKLIDEELYNMFKSSEWNIEGGELNENI